MNFVRKDFAKNIIKYHKDLNPQGHDVIKNSALTLKHTKEIIEGYIKIDHSIQVGKILWIIVKSKYGKYNFRSTLQIFKHRH